ncbi:MAG: hypothetical protein MN733_05955, partial [Nitrososphaera sp.]|nr:hypothetical protein [Nitrososphaera sp.]
LLTRHDIDATVLRETQGLLHSTPRFMFFSKRMLKENETGFTEMIKEIFGKVATQYVNTYGLYPSPGEEVSFGGRTFPYETFTVGLDRALLTFDVCLATSKCFDTFGVKELTHGRGRYWSAKHAGRKAIVQTNRLREEVNNLFPQTDLSKLLQDWFDHIDASIATIENFDSSYSPHVATQQLRESLERRGLDLYNSLSTCAGQLVPKLVKDTSMLRLFIDPVAICPEPFVVLCERIYRHASKICSVTIDAWEDSRRYQESDFCIKGWKNYLVVSHEDESEKSGSKRFLTRENDTILAFENSAFRSLGRYLIYRKNDSSFFDVLQNCFVPLNSLPKGLTDSRDKVFHIFEFKTWRHS